jgi:predicted AlkP superfamily phosphohydrolase/phosphomutase
VTLGRGRCRAILLAAFAVCAGAAGQGRVIVIGVDGLDYEVCRELMVAGDLPALSELAAGGSFIALYPSNPAQSPVSWATMTTGMNPGKTGVFDFLRRELGADGVTAELAFAERQGRPPSGSPAVRGVRDAALAVAAVLLGVAAVRRRRGRAWFAVGALAMLLGLAGVHVWDEARGALAALPRNARGGEAVWERLDAAGVPAVSVLAPMAFPAPELRHGHLLCGLGVPDVMGTPGTVTVYREEPVPADRAVTTTGCRVRSIRDDGGGRLAPLSVSGPRLARGEPRPEVPVGASVRRDARTVAFDGASGDAVPEGAWSPFLDVEFRLPWFQRLHALSRFRVLEAGPRVVLYQEPPCFDPRRQHASIPITSPLSFGAELAADGPFDTLGWACATNPLQDEVIDEATFLADVAEIERQREALVWRSLLKPGWRLFFCVLATPDRVQHVFWRDRDPKHSRHDPDAVRRRGDPIRDAYRRVDALVGRIRREVARPEDLVLVVSDHGFASFRWAVNLNRFLAEEGFLVGVGDRAERTLETSLGAGPLFPGVDWSKTRAYSLGLGKIYLNMKAEGGAVDPSERAALLEDIRNRLFALRHDGLPVVRSAKVREEIYRGKRVVESADLVIGFERGFRVSWQCTLGSLDEPVIAPNRNLWSGDHCSVDPELVAGVLFSSRKLDQSWADVADVCPTIEVELGVTPDPDEDGKPVRFHGR